MARARPPDTLLLRSRALAGSPMGRFLVRAAAVAALLLVSGIVMRQARAQAYRLPDYVLTSESVVFEGLPPWADARVEAALRAPERLDFRVSVFDPAAEERVRAAVAAHPLVKRVEQVRVLYPRKVAVRVSLRVPGCRVLTPAKTADGRPYLMLLSTDARRLDERCYSGWLAGRAPLPVLTGLARIGPPVEGVAWDNLREQVAEGLAAAAVAEQLQRDLGWGSERWVGRIDVSRFAAQTDRRLGEVLLVLSDGTAIEWGRTGRSPVPGDDDTYETKRARLRSALKDGAGKRIDVRDFSSESSFPQ